MKKTILTYIKVFFVLQFLFVLFGTISCLLPNTSVKKNIEKSVGIYYDEPVYSKGYIRHAAHQSDNFTDYLIMNFIYNYSPHKPLKYMLIPQCHMKGGGSEYASYHLQHSVENQKSEPNFEYGRYWHGSTFAYRFLFTVTDLSGVRWLNFLACSMAIFGLVYSFGSSVPKSQMYLFLLGMMLINYYVVFTSLQFTPVFIIALMGCISLIKKVKNHRRTDVLFLVLGAVTCYFDLLTAPVMTLGVPLLIWVILQPNVLDLFQKIKTVLGYSILWAVGYIASWLFKWLLLYVFSSHSIVEEIKYKLGERAGTWEGTRFDAIVANVSKLNLVIFNVIIIGLAILALIYFNRRGIKKAILFFLIALIPLVWYFVIANHSESHSWFTFRSLWISVSGLFLMVGSLIRWEDIKLTFSRKNKEI